MIETASCVKWNHEPINLVTCRQGDCQSFASGASRRARSQPSSTVCPISAFADVGSSWTPLIDLTWKLAFGAGHASRRAVKH
jgi:hypothetical protein